LKMSKVPQILGYFFHGKGYELTIKKWIWLHHKNWSPICKNWRYFEQNRFGENIYFLIITSVPDVGKLFHRRYLFSVSLMAIAYVHLKRKKTM
jgi:hypothetical protein